MPVIQLQKRKPNGEIVKWEVELMDLWQAEGSRLEIAYSNAEDGIQVDFTVTNPYITLTDLKQKQINKGKNK